MEPIFLKLPSYLLSLSGIYFLDKSLPFIQTNLPSVVFSVFLRLWRRWMMSDSTTKSSLEYNFISSNSYLCIEINAHALTLMYNTIGRYISQPYYHHSFRKDCFKAWLFGSKSCESCFRTARLCTPCRRLARHAIWRHSPSP